MARYKNVGSNPLVLVGGREIQPGEEFTPDTYHRPAGPDGPEELGEELSDAVLAFWRKVGGVEDVSE